MLELYRRAGGPKPPTDGKTTVASGSRVEVTPAGTYRLGPMSGDRRLTLGLALDLNTANAQDLEALPGPVSPDPWFLQRRGGPTGGVGHRREKAGPTQALSCGLVTRGGGALI